MESEHVLEPERITIESIFRAQGRIRDQIINETEIGPTIVNLTLMIFCAGAIYGLTMGIYQSPYQALVSALKVPLLFYLTLMTCLPTLHFVGLLLGCRVKFGQSMAVLLLGMAIMSVLLAAFAPISVFFLATGSEYNFLMVMHVAVFTFCGVAGLHSINKNFHILRTHVPGDEHPAARYLMGIWMALYMFVGTQMSYVMAPFVGWERTGFILFRDAPGNFYTEVWRILQQLLGG